MKLKNLSSKDRFFLLRIIPLFFKSNDITSGQDIKCPIFGCIKAGGSVRDHEIVLRFGVPCPKCVTTFDQVIDNKGILRREDIGAVTAYTLIWTLL